MSFYLLVIGFFLVSRQVFKRPSAVMVIEYSEANTYANALVRFYDGITPKTNLKTKL